MIYSFSKSLSRPQSVTKSAWNVNQAADISNWKGRTLFNPFSPRPHQNAFWYNNSWLSCLKILNYVLKEREKFLHKISPHLSQLNVVMAHRNYFTQNNLQIFKSATYKCWRSLFWVQIGNFLDWKGRPNVHILFFLHKTLSFTDLMKIKKDVLPIWW